jgi:hypothetical protein
MIPKDFTTFLASPENNDFSVEQIEKLLQQYPYVQSLRIALLRKLKATNHPNYQKHLHTTSAYAYDRVFLRKYINKENIYVVEYPAMKVEVEQLETLDLVPLGELKQEVDAPFLDLENTNSAANEITFPSDDWESIFNQNENITAETVENSEEIDTENDLEESGIDENQNEIITTETVENSEEIDTENDLEESGIDENQNEIITTETVENSEEIDTENDLEESGIDENQNEIITAETVENSEEIDTENDLEESGIDENQNEIITAETVENSEEIDTENDLEESGIDENQNENITAETVENSEEIDTENDLEESGIDENQNENITTETVENSEEIDQQSPITNQEMKDQKEIQALILESQRVEKHAPIEEDIDNLLGDDELEGLDDEVEFEFEIDKQIIGDEEDLSMFDDHGVNHHDDHDDKHFAEDNYEVSEHENHHGETDNSHEVKKPLHEIIHEKISDLITENPAIKEAKYEETVSENKDEEVVLKTEENFELSLDNVFRKDDRPAYIDVDDESELPLEEEQETIISTANVNEIRAALSDKYQNKEAKKERIKKYLQRIAQIPAEENGIITETYADLLAKQGKIERSIKMYQQLILKNPQKKVYFAAKIKQLIKNI